MSPGELAYLTMVFVAFAAFIGVVGFYSTRSRAPAQPQTAAGQGATTSQTAPGNLQMTWKTETSVVAAGTMRRPDQAA